MNVIAVVLWLTVNQCSLAGAAGITANLQKESRLVPTVVSRSGLGLPQWAGVRRTKMLRYLGSSWKDGFAQLQYLKTEALSLGVWQKVCAATDSGYSAEVFLHEFEKPKSPDSKARRALAYQIYNYAKTFTKEN